MLGASPSDAGALQLVLDYCEWQADTNAVMDAFGASRGDVENLYRRLVEGGAGLWRAGRFVPVASITDHATLAYLLTASRGGERHDAEIAEVMLRYWSVAGRTPFDEMRKFAPIWAAFAWIAAGLFLYLTEDNASLISWGALVYFTLGTAASSLVFGLTMYLSNALAASVDELSFGKLRLIRVANYVLVAAETVLLYFAARFSIVGFP